MSVDAHQKLSKMNLILKTIEHEYFSEGVHKIIYTLEEPQTFKSWRKAKDESRIKYKGALTYDKIFKT
jgi:hypothetical protein